MNKYVWSPNHPNRTYYIEHQLRMTTAYDRLLVYICV